MAVAKAITSAYVPLAGFIVSDRMHETIQSAPPDAKFMHGYTNAGHPTACAVALRNLRIIEEEGLVEHAAAMGERLRRGLDSLLALSQVGEVRSLGLLAAVELVTDKESRTPSDPAGSAGARVIREMRQRGVITRAKGDSVLLAPPLITSPEQIDQIVEVVSEAIQAAAES